MLLVMLAGVVSGWRRQKAAEFSTCVWLKLPFGLSPMAVVLRCWHLMPDAWLAQVVNGRDDIRAG